jgi:hypothetical protein
MKIKVVDWEKSFQDNVFNFKENESYFVQDKPSIHKIDGILTISINPNGIDATFHGPNSNFNAPSTGNLLKVAMKSGKDMYFLITNWTQDYVSARGNAVKLCYTDQLYDFINLAKI